MVDDDLSGDARAVLAALDCVRGGKTPVGIARELRWFHDRVDEPRSRSPHAHRAAAALRELEKLGLVATKTSVSGTRYRRVK